MSDLFRTAAQASARFDAGALAYDRYRPRYPARLFDDLVALGELAPGAAAIEVGAGTGIATVPLVERGFAVTAIEPAPAMAAVGREKLGDRARFVVGRFEDWIPADQVQLLVACNAWHWIDPVAGPRLASALLPAGGTLALVWTEIVSWGQDPFEDRLAEVVGTPWSKRTDHIVGSRDPVAADGRFGPFLERRYRFSRTLDAATYTAVAQTYGGEPSVARDRRIERLIRDEFGDSVTKVEDAVLSLCRRR